MTLKQFYRVENMKYTPLFFSFFGNSENLTIYTTVIKVLKLNLSAKQEENNKKERARLKKKSTKPDKKSGPSIFKKKYNFLL
jgi:hypothetical protein